ncbi:MAG: PorP/SprF family type IX secretion system membrane protein [Saprospiraceae bacterium]|jgi:type IX secretion system PorP/SprF family membrane protein|nr:PorP/SprF family type IX secretion system membrane protein [Saprospiraceae bacterium]MDP4819999.1 PorP/SprF family type IX secretion system membrane protein [Saprospiraceae bacterium]MDP4998450.1 PorP/SprF family type IX secretion system membrane protein [Saprospiraceae bacterium]
MKRTRLLVVLVSMVVVSCLQAQDIHYSMFHMSPLTLNPAHTGAFRGTARIGGIYRGQWFTVPNSDGFETQTIYLDAPIIRGFRKTDWVGVGMTNIGDNAGSARLKTSGSLISVAYHLALGKDSKNVLTLGVQGGSFKRRVNLQRLIFEDQLAVEVGGGGMNTTADNINENSENFFDINAGLMLRSSLSDDAQLEAGLAFGHINQPNYSLGGDSGPDERKRPMRINAHGRLRYRVSDLWTITPGFLWQTTGGATEFAVQSWAGYKLNDDYTLNGGLAYRFGDAAEVMAGLDYREDLRVTLSYDVNLSALNAATNSVGGFELSAFYILKLYKKPTVTPAILCPVF